MSGRIFLLCAGGTGGHMFPAQALAAELVSRGHTVHLATDDRGTRYTDDFAGEGIHVVPSATFGSRNPLAMARTALTLWRGYRNARALVKKLQPAVAVGFGGYPSLPPMMAARRSKLPLVLHEQNAVLGRANRALERFATVIAAGFASNDLPRGTIVTGNPLRDGILALAGGADYARSTGNEPFHLLVVGGSQGAQFFGETVPAALATLTPVLRGRLQLTLQARAEQVESARATLDAAGIAHEVAPFFEGMGDRLVKVHLVISRAGASTVSEVAALGRPSILVPYPFALDHDQAANAADLVGRGGGIIAPQKDLDAPALAALVTSAMAEPARLAGQAAAARATARLDATQHLADLVESAAKGG